MRIALSLLAVSSLACRSTASDPALASPPETSELPASTARAVFVEDGGPPGPEAEAIAELDRMFEATRDYFYTERKGQAATASFIGSEEPITLPPHVCPTIDGLPVGGQSGLTPDIAVDCSAGPDGHCVPSDAPSKPFEYESSTWAANDMFAKIGFSLDEPHRFHYNLIVINDIHGDFGGCMFTASAFGDLDGDYLFSTYERSAHFGEDGVASDMRVFNPGE